MPVSCPPQIRKLMKETVIWESFRGFDGHGEPSYNPPKVLKCRQEAYSVVSKGLTAIRRPDGTTIEPQWHMYFSGDDPDARKIQMYDRFTTTAVGEGPEQKLQAIQINTLYGPNWDDRHPWLVEVAL